MTFAPFLLATYIACTSSFSFPKTETIITVALAVKLAAITGCIWDSVTAFTDFLNIQSLYYASSAVTPDKPTPSLTKRYPLLYKIRIPTL